MQLPVEADKGFAKFERSDVEVNLSRSSHQLKFSFNRLALRRALRLPTLPALLLT